MSAFAGVVAFRPDPSLIIPLTQSLLGQTARVFVFVNGVVDSAVRCDLREAGAELIESEYNLGIAEALNILALASMLAGASRLLLMDQDSRPPEDLVARLEGAMSALQEAGETPAVVGPRIVSPTGEEQVYKPPRYFPVHKRAKHGACTRVRYVITSGSLIDLAIYRRIGPFRSDFFMDAVDTEWCFRAAAAGHSCWVENKLEMPHTIGGGMLRVLGLGAIPLQKPFRMYAYLRNQAHCLTLMHVPTSWKARIAAHLVRTCVIMGACGQEEYRLSRIAIPALRDGFAGRLGPPPGAEAAPTMPAPIVPFVRTPWRWRTDRGSDEYPAPDATT